MTKLNLSYFGVIICELIIIMAVLGLTVFLLYEKKHISKCVWILAFTITALIGFCISSEYDERLSIIETFCEEGENVYIYGKIDKIVKKGDYVWYYLEDAIASKKSGEEVKMDNIIVTSSNMLINALPGKTLEGYAKYSEFRISRNDGGFNEKKYYLENGINARFELDENQKLIISGLRNVIKCKLMKLREKCLDIINKSCKKKYAAIYSGILLGEKSEIDAETKELYKIAGISHLLAISGLHISMIGYFLFKVMRKHFLPISSLIVTTILLLAYTQMVGGSISAKRALIMFTMQLLAIVVGRTYDIMSALGLAFIAVIIANPRSVNNSGVLLSFGAIFGIAIVAPAITRLLKINSKIVKSFVVSECINIVIRPVLAYFYYEISLVSALINILILPFMGLMVVFGFAGAAVGFVSIKLSKVIMGCGCIILWMYEFVCKLCAKLPFSVIITGKPSSEQLICYYLTLFILLIIVYRIINKQRENDKTIIKYASVFIILTVSILFISYRWDSALKVQMLDVGQGDSIFINGDVKVLIDAGSSSESEITKYTILPFLKANGIKEIDYLVMTHSDNDHINGMEQLLEYKYNGKNYVNTLILPDISAEQQDEDYLRVREKAISNNVDILYFHKGQVIESKNYKLECIWPSVEAAGNRVKFDKNDLSITFFLSSDKFSMVFTGDLGNAGEKCILDDKKLGKADVLKVGHHGSNGSSSNEFIRRINPSVSLISCGINNRYGHPGRDTIDRLNNTESNIYITSKMGQINILEVGNGFVVETFLH